MSVPHGSLTVAIDAGATASKAALTGRDGRITATVTTHGFNLRGADVLKFRDLVVGMIRDLFHQADMIGHLPNAIAVGLAGAGREEERTMVREILQSRYPNVLVLVHHDAFIAHYGAFRGEPGVLVTSGTGSIAFGKNRDGAEARAGGWGWMLGDEGSGWWVGREAVRAGLAQWEGSGPQTALTQLLLDTFDVENAYEIVPMIYSERISRASISGLAEEVVRIAREEQDPAALRIVHVAGRQLGNLAVRAARVLQTPARELSVALLGSLALGGGALIESGVSEVLEEYRQEGKGDTASDQPEHPDSMEHSFPSFPPKDLTLSDSEGPTLITAQGDAIEGALLWAQDSMNKRRFA